MHKLAEKNPQVVINLLNERLKFERSGVQLYDSVIEKVTRLNDPNMSRTLEELREHRNEEKEHEEWLEEQIRILGGDVHVETDLSKLVTVESKGIEEIIINGDNNLYHVFHALLNAELVDNAGWELLVKLADDVGDTEAKRAFKKRLHAEEEHLEYVEKVVEKMAAAEVMRKQVKMPKTEAA